MIGIDIVSIKKFEKKLDKPFIKKIFCEKELEYAENKENQVQTLSGIFAAKESILKALSLNFSYLVRKKIQINHENNKITALVEGRPISGDISISHDGDYAIAICTASRNHNYVIPTDIKKLLIKRNKNTHKGDYGKVVVFGGSNGMAGSCFLSSKAALRAGAGLVYLCVPESISNVLQIKCTEQIIKTIESYDLKYNKNILNQILRHIIDKDVLAIGPGMGRDETLNTLLGKILSKFAGKIIIDADGLNALAKDKSILMGHKDIILTPHLKEFSRLSGLSINEINADRVGIATDFAREHKVILVLKSENTIITDGDNLYINEIGNPGMATAGSGDVLTGIISGFLPIMDNFSAAKLGVYLHSLAGDLASKELTEQSLIASDIIDYLPKAIKLLR